MDLFVRRHSEHLRGTLSDTSYNDDADDINNKVSSEIYDHRKWEWGYLRVSLLILLI